MKFVASVLTFLVLAFPASAEVDIKEVITPSGITVWLVEDHSIPFTALEMSFRGGTSLDAPGKRGAIYLMSGLLEEGAADLDARAYARELEALAASFSYNVGDDAMSISARFLSENRDEAMAMLYDTLHKPRFDQEAIDRVRAQIVSGLNSDTKDPNSIASAAFLDMAFDDHPYATEGEGTIESVNALSRDDILDAYHAVFARDRLFVGAVGDITPDQVSALVETLLADLPETGALMPEATEVLLQGGVRIIDFDTPQSVALFGHNGIDQDDDDFFAAYILNQILGGGSFESRLMTEVREKRGLTYGVYSYLASKDFASLYMGSVASANDRIAEAVSVIQDEWAKIQSQGVTQEDLDNAKTYLTGAYPLRFDGNSRIAGILVGMQMMGLPIDYIATRNDKVNAVTLADANRVAAELYDPEGLQFVVVGRPEGLEATN
ncbi:MAG: zinc protease [Paracoccaceae bacterium]|jgi:zinc protease